MTGADIMFLTLAIVMIIAIVILELAINNNFKNYRECWEPIYKNRIEHFDEYLKYALARRTEAESIEDVAKYAAYLNCEYTQVTTKETFDVNNYIDTKAKEYEHELRCANIE